MDVQTLTRLKRIAGKSQQFSQRFKEIRNLLISASEHEFEEIIEGYEYFVDLDKPIKKLYDESEIKMLDYCQEVEQWLQAHCAAEFIAFPSSMGKYAERSNGVYFKNRDDALMFKLSF